MRILITGDRNWTDKDKIRAMLSSVPDVEEVIEGEARGADTLGKEVAQELEIPVESYPADWSKYHKAAGHIRNQQMLDEGKPNLVLAFHSHIEQSRGTADMIRRAKKAGIEVRLTM